MKSFPDTLTLQKRRPLWWTSSIVALMLIDFAAPPPWGLCVLHLLMLPLAWRFLHRRVITRFTVMQATAVALAGLWHALYGPILDESLLEGASLSESRMRAISGYEPLYFDPVRLWTFLALMAAGYFHVYLRRRLRLRIKHQQELQQGVRRRSQEVARINHALRDEVARRQATQHRLDQSETTFQSIMDRMHLQVARKNAEGVFTYANDPFCKELGMQPIEVIGSTDAELYSPKLAARYRADDLNVMLTGLHVDKVEEHPGADGRSGFVQVFKAPEYDQHGNCIGIQAIFWDVTEKHRGAMALQNSEARKRALFDAAGDAVLLVDDRGVIMEANPAAMTLLQAGGGRLVGRPLEDLIMPVATSEQPTSTLAAFRRETMTWETLPFTQRHQLRLRRGDGVAFDSEVSVHPIPLGERKGRAVIIRDITLQQQAFDAMREAKVVAEQANHTKTQFMAGISHELRTPLGGIRGLSELLAAQTLPPLARRYVNLISQNTELLHDAIEDILDFSAIEAGRVAIDPNPIDLHETVSDAFGCLAIRVANKPVRLSLSIAPQTPRQVIADAKRVRQIIVNLVGNAIKFTPRGLVKLRLRQVDETTIDANDLDDMATFEISITDTGIGIAPENQKRIFDAFEQADRGTNKQYGGTGLGLAIARGLAERMGGGIELTSTVGSGSCFRVRLRFKTVPAPADTLPSSADTVSGNAGRSPRGVVVLSVDNEAIEEALTEILVYDGWAVRRPSQLRAVRNESLSDAVGESLVGDPNGSPESASSSIAWILINETADAVFRIRARKSQDRVLWLTRTGEPTPRRAKKQDTVMIEPVMPDELRRWLAGQPLHQTSKEASGQALLMQPPDNEHRPTTTGTATTGTATIGTATNLSTSTGKRISPATCYRLLVVDDSPTNRLVIHDQLASVGHHVQTADGGRAAIELFQKETFDCILMDLQMPGMDGTEVTALIFRVAAQQGRPAPPVIALTAHITDQHRNMCRDAGMVGYVTKPVHLTPLLVEIQRVISKQSAAPEMTLATPTPTSDAASEQPPIVSKSTPANSNAPSHNGRTDNDNTETDTDDEAWRERLAKHCGHDESTMASVCDGISMELPDLIRRLDRSAADGNAKSFRTAAHTLKSCLRYIAPPEHNDLAADLERCCEDNDWFDRLHQDWKTKTNGAERQQLSQVQHIAKTWSTRVQNTSAKTPPESPRTMPPII